MGVYKCAAACGFQFDTPTVEISLIALPIAKALKLPGKLERLVDFVREEMEREKKNRQCPQCGAELLLTRGQ